MKAKPFFFQKHVEEAEKDSLSKPIVTYVIYMY